MLGQWIRIMTSLCSLRTSALSLASHRWWPQRRRDKEAARSLSRARAAKSHSGLRATFARLAKDDPGIDRTFTRFLARAYKFKEIADYGIGPQAVVTAAKAQEMIDLATRFVDRIVQILASPIPGPQAGECRFDLPG